MATKYISALGYNAFEQWSGAFYDDDQGNTIYGLDNNYLEVIRGFGGDDIIYGGLGTNGLYGGNGNDQVFGGSGYDFIQGEYGSDWLFGGGGYDTVSFTDHTGRTLFGGEVGWTIDMNAELATTVFPGRPGALLYATETDHVFGFENVLGFNAGDTIIANNHSVEGMGGNDILTFRNFDKLGNSAKFDGGAGIDTVSFAEISSAIIADLATGVASMGRLDVAGGIKVADLVVVENLTGTAFGDTLAGGIGENTINGLAGNDTLNGYSGNDQLTGGVGSDRITGGLGRDVLTGGSGGAAGDAFRDVFIFKARTDSNAGIGIDRITDFTVGRDDIDLSAIDARSLTATNEAFAFIGTQAFHGVAGELRYQQAAGITHVWADVNGDRVADFSVQLDGLKALAAGDFIF